MSMLALNSDPLLSIWADIFLSYSLFHLFSLLAPILRPISLYYNFPLFFQVLFYFEVQFNAGYHFLKQLNYFDYENSMPKTEAEKDIRQKSLACSFQNLGKFEATKIILCC